MKQGVQSGSAILAGKLRRLILPFAILILHTLSAPSALAALSHPLKATLGPFENPRGVAVDQANGNVFVANVFEESGVLHQAVEIVGPEGGAPSGVAVTKIEGFSFNERVALAIDNSTASPSKGTLYVADTGHESVKKFTLNPLSEEYEPKGSLSASPALSQPLGIAIDAKGNVFVSDRTNVPSPFAGAIVEFSPAGVEIGRIQLSEASPTLKAGTDALAFDSAGNLYAVSHGGQGIWKFAANGAGEIEPSTVPSQFLRPQVTPTGISIDQASDTLYVALGNQIAQYSTSCVPVPTPSGAECQPEREFGAGILGETSGLATSPINGDIYAADADNGDVALFGAALAIVPDVETKPASEVKLASGTLNGTVSAAAGPAASCQFQYTTTASFKAEGFKGATAAPCSPTGPFTGAGKEAVRAEVSGLGPQTAYVFRTLASNENGPSFGEALPLTTIGLPKIDASSIASVTLVSATAVGLINPNGGPGAAEETSYFVEYISAAEYEENKAANPLGDGFEGALKSPPSGGQGIGSGTKDVKVAQELSGLAAATTYHFRIVAENEAGEKKGPDKTFATFLEGPPGLPDARAYEQVSPVDKNGAAPAGSADQVQAAADGSGIVYLSGGSIPGAEGAQEFPVYLASRGSDWTTQGLLPPASGGSIASVLGWDEGLAHSYAVQAATPGAPVSFLQRSSATHATQEIATFETNFTGHDGSLAYVGASADGATVIFESPVVLSPGGAANAFNTYAWDRASGELSLVGVFNNGFPPAKGSLAGSNEVRNKSHYNQAQHAVSSDGSRVFFTDIKSGQLYLRLNPTQPQSAIDGAGKCTEADLACTIQVSASQRTDPDPKGKKPATFMAATPDGSKIFFTSPGKLTDDATTGPADAGDDLYRYDAASGGLTDLTADDEAGDPNGAEVLGVLGASDDGSYVYFAANGVLADGAVPGDCRGITPETSGEGSCNLYLWHEGTTVFIASMKMRNAYDTADSTNWLPASFQKFSKTSRVTPDGQTLLFRAQENLTPYDSGGLPELYRYSAAGGELSCLSCNPSGAAPVEAPTLRSIEKNNAGGPVPVLTRNLSQNGERVLFESADKLVANDTNGVKDVYEWEASGAGSCESEAQNGGCLYLISTGTDPEPSFFADASADGADAFIFTGQSLVGQDRDRILDIYDARVGGGIASQYPPPPPIPCGGEEACKGASPPAPAAPSPGSAGFSGPGNQKAPPQHKKQHRHKKKRHHRKRQASSRKHG